MAAKKSGLEWACLNNDNFTVLVSGGGRCHWVSMCTVWPLHTQYCVAFNMTEQVEPWICVKFCLELEHFSVETIGMIQKAATMGNWWLAASSWQHIHSCITYPAEIFGKTSNYPGESDSLDPRFGALQHLAFPKTKITFEREEISDLQENTMEQLMATGKPVWGSKVPTLKGTEESLSFVQCFLYLQ